MLNEDSSSFTLWKANPTAQEYLMAVDKNNNPIHSNCTIKVISSNNESKLSKGAIAGIAVSAAAALLIIALLAYRTSKKNEKVRGWLNQPTDYDAHAKTGPPDPPDVPLQNLSSSELDVYSPRPPTELNAENEMRELIELPARMSESRDVDVKPKS
jgi:hypothetical protein